MRSVYLICLAVSFIILLLNLLGDLLEGVHDFFDLFIDIDFFDLDLSFLPFSGASICAGLLLFGGVGLLTDRLSVAALSGLIVSLGVQQLYLRMKKVDSSVSSRDELYQCTGVIVNAILPEGTGVVAFTKQNGTSSTYPCKFEYPKLRVEQGTKVKLLKFEGEVAIVTYEAEPEDL